MKNRRRAMLNVETNVGELVKRWNWFDEMDRISISTIHLERFSTVDNLLVLSVEADLVIHTSTRTFIHVARCSSPVMHTKHGDTIHASSTRLFLFASALIALAVFTGSLAISHLACPFVEVNHCILSSARLYFALLTPLRLIKRLSYRLSALNPTINT